MWGWKIYKEPEAFPNPDYALTQCMDILNIKKNFNDIKDLAPWDKWCYNAIEKSNERKTKGKY